MLSSSCGSTAESTVTGMSVARTRPRSVNSTGDSSAWVRIVTLSGKAGISAQAAPGSMAPGVTNTGIDCSASRSKPLLRATSAERLATEASKLLPVMRTASTSRSMASPINRSKAVNVADSIRSRTSSDHVPKCCNGQSSRRFAACSSRSGLAAMWASLPNHRPIPDLARLNKVSLQRRW